MVNKFLKIFLLLLSSTVSLYSQVVSGYVLDAHTGEKLSGVSVKNSTQEHTVISNSYGHFSIKSQNSNSIEFYIFGYQKKIIITDSTNLNNSISVDLIPESRELKEIKVIDKRITNELEPSKVKLSNAFIKSLPTLLGEKDLIKTFQFLPGIQEISEGSTSLSVRGGGKDQNLILLDESTVYNANHLFGFFSTFNVDAVKQAEIYKGAFPARYGGRLSSIIDVKMKEGNNKQYELEGGIGLIASRLMVQGPIKTNKSSFLIAGRRTYADWLIKPFMSDREQNAYNFGDLNAKVNFKLGKANHLYLSYYLGNDKFYQKNKLPRGQGFLIDNTRLQWGNQTTTLRLNTIINKRLFQNTSLIFSKYAMDYVESSEQSYLSTPRKSETALNSNLRDLSLKVDYNYYVNPNLNLEWGGIHTLHHFSPRHLSYSSVGMQEGNFSNKTPVSNHQEGALYLNLTGKKNNFFYENGLRLSYYLPLGKVGFEPRLMIGYKAPKQIIVSGAYSRMNQYVHLVSNTGSGLPTDIWIPSNSQLKPAFSDIVSVSISKNLKSKVKISAEAYYKWIYGNNAYKSNVSFLGIGRNSESFLWEDILTQGKSWNYGYEFSIEKALGRFTGFGGYTLAWSISKFEELNAGKPFFNLQDRRHIVEFTGSYAISPKLSFVSSFIFASGNALPVPSGIYFRYNHDATYIEHHQAYNSFRAENYHRLDMGLNIKTKRGNWDISIYNVYNRKNPYSYEVKNQIVPKDRIINIQLGRQWLMPIIPSVTYNFKI